eukprot:431335-Amphidinium_carterae.1
MQLGRGSLRIFIDMLTHSLLSQKSQEVSTSLEWTLFVPPSVGSSSSSSLEHFTSYKYVSAQLPPRAAAQSEVLRQCKQDLASHSALQPSVQSQIKGCHLCGPRHRIGAYLVMFIHCYVVRFGIYRMYPYWNVLLCRSIELWQ